MSLPLELAAELHRKLRPGAAAVEGLAVRARDQVLDAEAEGCAAE